MDSTENTQTPSIPTPFSFPKKYLFIILGIIILIIIGVFIYLWQKQLINLSFINKTTTNKTSQQNSTEKIIAKVGEENIYQKDLDIEIYYYPPVKNLDIPKFLLDKIIKDSIILQAAKSEGLITLDPTVYNSPSKDYFKRIDLVENAKKQVTSNQVAGTSGAVIAVWFVNPHDPNAKIKPENKTLAYSIADKYYQELKTGKITIYQAAEGIKKEIALSSANPYFRDDVLIEFKLKPDEEYIVPDSKFNTIMLNLKEGEISNLHLAQYPIQGKSINAVYLFGQVSKKTDQGQVSDFDEWLNQKKDYYEINYY